MNFWLEVPGTVELEPARRVMIPSDRALLLGRAPDADIGFSERSVSRLHCEVGRDPCGAWVRDRISRNGTFINGDQIQHGPTSRLRPGDELSVHDVRMPVGWDFALAPEWLCWEAGRIVLLALQVREDDDFDAVSVLGDALEDAGCYEAEILDHLRGRTFHLRECWIIDAILKANGFESPLERERVFWAFGRASGRPMLD